MNKTYGQHLVDRTCDLDTLRQTLTDSEADLKANIAEAADKGQWQTVKRLMKLLGIVQSELAGLE